MSQLLIQIQEQIQLKPSQILRTYGKQFKQIRGTWSDGENGRCAIGVFRSYFGWDGISKNVIMSSIMWDLLGAYWGDVEHMNDAGATFDQIADYLESVNK